MCVHSTIFFSAELRRSRLGYWRSRMTRRLHSWVERKDRGLWSPVHLAKSMVAAAVLLPLRGHGDAPPIVLRACLGTEGPLDNMYTRRKILTYVYPGLDPYTATPLQMQQFEAVKRWISRLDIVQCSNAAWVKSVADSAHKNAEAQERIAQLAGLSAWIQWINEGPSAGLRRQHVFSRCSAGWTVTGKSTGIVNEVDATDGKDDDDDVLDKPTYDELNHLKQEQAVMGTPCTAQQQVEDQAKDVAPASGAEQDIRDPEWPEDMGPLPPRLLREELIEAATTYPADTGLDLDKLHPRATSRFSDETLGLLARILGMCERDVDWPIAVAFVIIALLPKPEGDLRPTGLLPFLPRLWMRARRRQARMWEEENQREYLCAGKAKGVNVAAWKNAFNAEWAAALGPGVEYVQGLLDLVKKSV